MFDLSMSGVLVIGHAAGACVRDVYVLDEANDEDGLSIRLMIEEVNHFKISDLENILWMYAFFGPFL